MRSYNLLSVSVPIVTCGAVAYTARSAMMMFAVDELIQFAFSFCLYYDVLTGELRKSQDQVPLVHRLCLLDRLLHRVAGKCSTSC